MSLFNQSYSKCSFEQHKIILALYSIIFYIQDLKTFKLIFACSPILRLVNVCLRFKLPFYVWYEYRI